MRADIIFSYVHDNIISKYIHLLCFPSALDIFSYNNDYQIGSELIWK